MVMKGQGMVMKGQGMVMKGQGMVMAYLFAPTTHAL
jgi:hypothetical protein